MLEIGSVLEGKYKILNLIGHGGMSNVYLAINEKANKTWAVKEVRKQKIDHFEVYRKSLMAEIELLKKIDHPNLPSIIDVIDEDDDFYIVMDYIEGVSLQQRLEENKAISQEEIIAWGIQLCDVLDYLHHLVPPIIYRDMKPSNVMLQPNGTVILVDFGTAREYKNEQGKEKDTTCLGTLGYAAPEQFGGMGQSDERTDIYNLGATLYHLLTGHDPSMPPYEMYPIRHWKKDFSSGLEQIVLKCTNKNPKERYQSAKELKYALQHYRQLDEEALSKNKKRLVLCIVLLCMGVISAAGSISCVVAAKQMEKRQYSYYMEQASKITDSEQKIQLLLLAIQKAPENAAAYQALNEIYLEDGVFDEAEELTFLQLMTDMESPLQQLKAQDEAAYATFCYHMGNAYWYYYVHEESRQLGGLSWYESAAEYYESSLEESVEKRRVQLFLTMGNFYKKIMAAQIDGTDQGMYATYWDSMSELLALNRKNGERDMIQLRSYLELSTKILEYARYFVEDGISKEEILDCLNDMQSHMEQIREGATQNVRVEIDSVTDVIREARQMVNANEQDMEIEGE